MSFRVIVIDESDEDEDVLMLNEEVEEEDVADAIVEMVEEGEIETFEECSTVCDFVSEMLKKAGVEIDYVDTNTHEAHEVMINELRGMKLVKKEEGNGEKKIKKIVKKENGNGKKR